MDWLGLGIFEITRLGYTIASSDITALFNKTKAPYNISTLTASLAKQALSHQGQEIMCSNIQSILRQRKHLSVELGKYKFIGKILGSCDANFLLVEIINEKGAPDNLLAFKIYKYLAEIEGIVVRFRGHELGCNGCLRITIGTPNENEILLKKLKTELFHSL